MPFKLHVADRNYESFDIINSSTLSNEVTSINPIEHKLLNQDIFDATEKRMECPTSFEPVYIGSRRFPYYRIYVGNFIIYYAVIDRQVEYRRVLYKKMNVEEL